MEVWAQKETLYAGQVVRLEVGQARLDDGTEALREVVQHPGGVAVVPVVNGKVVLIRQFRIAVGADVLELPAGKLEGVEDTEARGRAELEEETGYRADRLISLGAIYASVGYTSEEIHLYLALEPEKHAQRLEEDERIDVVEMPLEEVREALAAHRLPDAKTIVGLERALHWLEQHGDTDTAGDGV